MEPAIQPYRQLLAEDSPLSISCLDSPWIAAPDLPRYNRRAFNFIKHDLGILRKAGASGQRPISRGILVLGEAGSGKTHLLMRVARQLSQDNPLLFIPRPTNEEAVAQHIWEKILESLSQKYSAETTSRTQLDVLLTRVFSRILIRELESELSGNRESEQKQRWIDTLSADPNDLPSLLGQGEGRGGALNAIRRKILNHLSIYRPNADQSIARVLVTYCLVAAENKKRILRSWLAGHEIEEVEARELGLASAAVRDDGTLSQASLQQAREQYSLKCIQTLGELSIYHAPLILAFDQLEGLRYSQALTRRWADTVRELFTMAPNFLIITCAFPSLWKEWFAREVDDSAAQRLAQNQVVLDAFGPEHARQLLAAHLDNSFSKHRLPTALYPFTPEDVGELCAQSTSARAFLQAARTRLLDWLSDDDSDESCLESAAQELATTVTSQEIVAAIHEYLTASETRNFNSFKAEPASEHSLFGRLHELARASLHGSAMRETTVRHATRVLPMHVQFHCETSEKSVVLAVCNANGTAFTSRVKNLLSALKPTAPKPSFVLVRDQRCSTYTPGMRKVLDECRTAGAHFVLVDQDSFAGLMGLHDCLVAAEERNLTTGKVVINRDKLLPYFPRLILRPGYECLGFVREALNAECPAPTLPSGPAACNDAASDTAAPLVNQPPTKTDRSSKTDDMREPPPSAASILLGFERPIGRAVEWELSIRKNPHLMIVGLPGMGKTTCIVNACVQLVSQGITPIVFSYHEDMDAQLQDRLGSLNRVEHSSLGFNPLRLHSAEARAHIDSAGMMRDIFSGIFPDLGELQTNQIRQAIKQSYEASRGRAPRFRDFYAILEQQPKPDKGLMARLSELDDYGLFSSASDAENLLATSTPSVVALHRTPSEMLQRAFASLLFYRIYQEMFLRGLQQRITHAIVFDEAHRASRLKLLATMGKECRKFGLSLILASQEARDFSPSMYSAVANYLVLRVTDQDARALAKNVAPSTQAKRVADELKQLPKHEAVFFQEGQGRSRMLLCEDAKLPLQVCAEALVLV